MFSIKPNSSAVNSPLPQEHHAILPMAGSALEVAFFEQGKTKGSIVLLHEALGSLQSWGTFPTDLAAASKMNVLAYSRRGHGRSPGPPSPRTPARFQNEARLVLPRLLKQFGITNPILYGHSEGAALALTYALANPSVQGVILECPYLVKQDFAGTRLERLRPNYHGSALQRLLSRHHECPDEVFYSWVNWASDNAAGAPAFDGVPQPLSVPTLVLQGADDSFGSHSHLEVVRKVTEQYRHRIVVNGGHLLHRNRPDVVLDEVCKFLEGKVKREELICNPEPRLNNLRPNSGNLMEIRALHSAKRKESRDL